MLKKLKYWIKNWLRRPNQAKPDEYDNWYPDR